MITRNDVLKYSKEEKCWFVIEEDGTVLSKKNEPHLIVAKTVDEFVLKLNQYNHSNFKCIYSDPCSLDVVLECQDCGAIIFTGDDERYNPNLKCPICSKTDQGVEYWTKEDIKQDIKKQNTLKFFRKDMEMRERDYQRYKKTGLNSWELWKKEKRDKEGRLLKKTTLERMGMKGIRGLNLKVSFYVPDEELGSVHKKTKTYPLSIYAWKVFRKIRKKKKEKNMKKLNVSFEPADANPILGGVRYRFKFDNGYGASVICHMGSYGGKDGLWELA